MNLFRKYVSIDIFLILFLFVLKSNAQIKDTGEIFIEISSIISGMPGNSGNDYSDPSTNELNSWGNVLKNLLDNNYSVAADTAAVLDYDLIQFLDTSNATDVTYYLLKANDINYWGTYIYNPNYCRNLVIQSPHPIKDFNTGKEGIHVFHESNSFFFMLSGTSRCNHSSFSTCSGTTSTCSGSSESYRISDLAHKLSTIYQSTTDTLLNRYSSTYFIQLHGFSKLSTDPFIILSNGTQNTPTLDYIATLETNLEAEDALFVDSIKVAHQDLSWTRLRGFTNVQGRLINSSVDVCNSNATGTNGRFIHMEQEKTRLRDDETGWNKAANAIKNTFGCTPLPIQLIQFKVMLTLNNTALLQWSTATEINNDYFTVERSTNGYNWEPLKVIDGAGYSSTVLHYQTVDYSPHFGVSYYRLKQTDYDGQFDYSQIKTISRELENGEISIYPNPAKSDVIVKGNRLELETLIITNYLGLETKCGQELIKNLDHWIVKVDLSHLTPGLYIIRTRTTANKLYKQ